jgi:hypothetical protein
MIAKRMGWTLGYVRKLSAEDRDQVEAVLMALGAKGAE